MHVRPEVYKRRLPRGLESMVPVARTDKQYGVSSLLKDGKWQLITEAMRLSKREEQIVSGIIDGKSEAQISHGLGISPHTVHTYLSRMYRKLGVDGRCGTVVRVFHEYVRLEANESVC